MGDVWFHSQIVYGKICLLTVSLINNMLDESPVESIHNKYNNQTLGILNNFILEFSKANCVMTPNRSSAAL